MFSVVSPEICSATLQNNPCFWPFQNGALGLWSIISLVNSPLSLNESSREIENWHVSWKKPVQLKYYLNIEWLLEVLEMNLAISTSWSTLYGCRWVDPTVSWISWIQPGKISESWDTTDILQTPSTPSMLEICLFDQEVFCLFW